MCSIIGSYNKEKFKELVELNQFKGNFSYSFGVYNTTENRMVSIVKEFGQFKSSTIEEAVEGDNLFYIGHVQAPTGGLIQDVNRIHPTTIKDTMLWHNGIITSRGIKYLQEKFNTTETFDTKLLHTSIEQSGCCDVLSDVEGLFTCLYYNRDLFLFRTKHGKIHIDKDMSFSSERFTNSFCINYDTVYKIDFKNNKLSGVGTFKTKRFNIIVNGEI